MKKPNVDDYHVLKLSDMYKIWSLRPSMCLKRVHLPNGLCKEELKASL